MAKLDPSFVLNAGTESAELCIYGQIGVSFWDDESTSARQVSDRLSAMSKSVTDITVRINSFGGSLADGFAIYNALKAHPACVTVVVDGVAMSAASLIAMAGDVVKMPGTSLMMIHSPSCGAHGNAVELRKAAAVLDKFSDAMVSAYTSKSGKSAEDIKALLDGEDHFYTGAEAVDAGFADMLVGDTAPTALFASSAWTAAVSAAFKTGLQPPPSRPLPQEPIVENNDSVTAELAALTASVAESKALLASIQAANDAALATAKAETDSLRSALNAEVEAKAVTEAVASAASAYAHLPVTASDLGPALRSLKKLAPVEAALIEAVLAKCDAAVAQTILTPVGKSVAETAPSAAGQVAALVAAKQAANPALTEAKAEGLVFAENPSLYNALAAEKV